MRFEKKLLRAVAVIAALSLAAGVFAACGQKAEAPKEAAPKEETAKAEQPQAEQPSRLSVVLGENVVALPLVGIAREKGYFAEYGLEIDSVTMESSTIEALDSNKVDIVLNGIIPTLSFAAQGSGVKIIGGTASGGNFIIAKPELAAKLRADSSFSEWKGKKYGIVRLSTTEMVTRYALGQKGFDLENDLSLVEIDSYPNIIEGVRKGEIEIGSVASEYAQQIAELGLEVVYPLTELLPSYVCCRVSVSPDAYQNKRAALVKFLKGEIRAYKDYLEDQDGVVKLLAEASRQTEEYAYNILYDREANADRVFDPEPNLNGVVNIYDTLLKWGYVEDTGVKASDIVDTTLFEEALEEILKEFPEDTVYQQLKANFAANN